MMSIVRLCRLLRCELFTVLREARFTVRSPGETRGAVKIGAVALCAFLLVETHVRAQDAPLKVAVDGAAYLVNGATVSRQTGSEPLDAATVEKARFTARVLEQQVLHSEFNKQIFAPTYRAVVFSDGSSGRLIEPWRKQLRSTSPAALAKAKEQFKAWATKLALDPREPMLAVARQDYLDGIDAYRENAAIYRSVAQLNRTLTYDGALALMRNSWPTIQLAYARGLEGGNSAPANNAAVPAQAGADPFAQQLQAEVIRHVDSDVNSAEDFDRLSDNVRKFVESNSADVQNYRESIRPPAIRFTAFEPMVGSAPLRAVNSGSVTTTYAGQNTVSITTPRPALKGPPLVDITGGILPSPYPIRAPSPAGGSAGGNSPTATQAGSPAGNPAPAAGSGSTPAGPGGSAGANQSGAGNASGEIGIGSPAPAGSTAPGAQSSISSDSDINSVDNLKTYSSKGYHSSGGWIFNPATGLWQNPNDPSQTNNPTVITCCDETGLAFPSDAVEAQQDYAWNEAGTDPNCGRLYICGPSIDPGPDPGADVAAGPTDQDAAIWKALSFFDHNKGMTPEEKGAAIINFLRGLPPQYQDRGVQLLREYNGRHSGGSVSAGPAPVGNARVNRTYASGQYSGRSTPNQSTITGRGGVSSHYTPITQSAAQNIVGKYKSIPGGVTLEGDGIDLSFVKKVAYLKTANAFIINDDLVYLNPVSLAEYSEIQEALSKDDKIGVSLGEAQIVYGALPPHGTIAMNLKIADRLLGSLAFFNSRYLIGYETAPGYRHERLQLSRVAAYFNFHEFRFTQNAAGELMRTDVTLSTTLIPVAQKSSREGASLPDFEGIKLGNLSAAAVANLKNLQDNISYYARERIVRQAMAFGEAAAMARSLKANGIRLELN